MGCPRCPAAGGWPSGCAGWPGCSLVERGSLLLRDCAEEIRPMQGLGVLVGAACREELEDLVGALLVVRCFCHGRRGLLLLLPCC